ncbi:Vault protein inter-alpha-trypsin [Enhygromyxa salina]|uniref:Vault protein inter-alpha-trypsin n=1 Tax=Enhygromyxa salina TaxID=215803 RepID=A0A2S9YGV6_9BACT|nr:VIT domain-containing protein [Enhygromyxa salina]PRQ04334.1 Vault protein inter-alpha-trypsin [Enhygromyxa salina]
MPETPRARTILRGPSLLLALALPLSAPLGCQRQPDAGAAEGEADPGTAEQAAEVGKITKIRGSRGVGSPDLPEGAFLGEGATVHAGQWLELPRGTRVELELGGGQRLRLDEDSRLRLPTTKSDAEQLAQVELTRGRLVVLADAAPLEVLTADDRLVVERGEVELHHAGETRHFGVVQGRAMLHTAGREIPLGPGASISTPAAPTTRPETPPDETLLAAAFTPVLSLAPLQEAAWAESFERSARIAADLPEGVGSLVARRAGSKVERQSLRLTEQKVEVTISGRIARTEIEQAFHNDSGQTLEGIYQFPLPSDASISDLQLLVGDEWMRGEMLEKRRARQIFRQIVDATVPRDPALLQWEQGSVFKLNIFPIPGKGERRIKIAYTQVLPAVGDALRYRYPMGGSGATATEIGDFTFNVTIDDAGLDAETLDKVSTPMAELQRTRARGQSSESGAGLELSMHERDYQPTHELGVDVPLPSEDQRRVLAATHRDRDGQGYFMLTLRPDLELRAEPEPVHYAFVLDRSHGTTPELWAAAQGMTKAMLATLEPDDRFTLLACDTGCDRLDGGLQAVSRAAAGGPDTLAEVDRFLNRQVLAGASDIGNMLECAGAMLGEPEGEVEQVVVYMGDGVPTSGALTPDELGELAREQLGRLRVQAVALGARSDLLILDKLVRQSGGDLIQADTADDLDSIARELRLRAQVPVARDLAVELPSGLTDVYPKSIPALRPGDSLTLVGKLAEGDAAMLRGDVRLHGSGGAGEVDERFQVMLDAEYSKSGRAGVHAHLPRTWAQHEITHLTQTEGAAASERIVELSREYNVLSRFTALLVLENDRMYREFNVARKAGQKDSWNEDPATATEVDNEARAEGASSEATPELEPGPSEDREREQSEAAPQPSPAGAPAPAPAPKFSDFDGFDPLEPSSSPSDASAVAEQEAFAEDDFDGFDFDDNEGDASGLIGGGSSSGSSASIPSAGKREDSARSKGGGDFAPAPPAKKKSKNNADSKAPSSPGGWDVPQKDQRQWQWPQMTLRDAGGPTTTELDKIAQLERVRDANPSSRKAHRDLVRRAIRDNHSEARAFTAAWAAADPDHAPALLAHADQIAASGDPLALRAYASALEVEPFSTRMHGRMAEALTHAGDFERACSHRRALVSIDPTDGDHAAKLVSCLAQSGRITEARAALSDARERVTSSAGKKALTRAEKTIVTPSLASQSSRIHASADLRAELRWTADENLDLAFVDHRGRRLSVLRPQGVRVREEHNGAARVEIMTMREVNGTVFIEVTRPDVNAEEPVSAKLTVKTATGRRSWSLSLEPGTRRVALTRWKKF